MPHSELLAVRTGPASEKLHIFGILDEKEKNCVKKDLFLIARCIHCAAGTREEIGVFLKPSSDVKVNKKTQQLS